jgi:hypothetical protein
VIDPRAEPVVDGTVGVARSTFTAVLAPSPNDPANLSPTHQEHRPSREQTVAEDHPPR